MGNLDTIISSDSHMLEPADLWVERIDAKYRDIAPRVYFDEDKQTWLFGCPGVPPTPAAALFAAGKTDQELKEHEKAGFDQARAGGWDPAERLKDMAIDGIAADVLYTSLGFNLFWLEDGDFQEACFRVYNDWLAEFCAYAPDRFVGLGMVSLWNVDNAIAELQRIRNLGLRGAMIWASPPEDMSYFGRYHDTFWAAAQDLDMPISLHILTGQGTESRGFALNTENRYLRLIGSYTEIQRSLARIVFSGTFDRFPKLKVVSAENGIGWIPYFLQRGDAIFKRYRHVDPAECQLPPSEYFRRNVWCTFINDRVGVFNIPLIGADNVMWSSDYPHQASTWPNSREVIERDFAGIDEAAKIKVCRDNAALLYGFDLSKLTPLQREAVPAAD